MSRKRIIIIAVVAIVVVGAAIVGFYAYQGAHFVETDNAKVSADLITVSPEISGTLLSWNVAEGDMVQEGQIMGRQDLGLNLQTGGMNPGSMATVGAVIADRATIKAPISGMVIKSNAVVGELSSPGRALAIVADTSHIYINANVKEGDISRIKLGQPVDISVDAIPGRTFSGRVASIGRATAAAFSLLAATNDTGNFTKVVQVVPVKIDLIGTADSKMMIGMNATVHIRLE